jgi:hypothetical protein
MWRRTSPWRRAGKPSCRRTKVWLRQATGATGLVLRQAQDEACSKAPSARDLIPPSGLCGVRKRCLQTLILRWERSDPRRTRVWLRQATGATGLVLRQAQDEACSKAPSARDLIPPSGLCGVRKRCLQTFILRWALPSSSPPSSSGLTRGPMTHLPRAWLLIGSAIGQFHNLPCDCLDAAWVLGSSPRMTN